MQRSPPDGKQCRSIPPCQSYRQSRRLIVVPRPEKAPCDVRGRSLDSQEESRAPGSGLPARSRWAELSPSGEERSGPAYTRAAEYAGSAGEEARAPGKSPDPPGAPRINEVLGTWLSALGSWRWSFPLEFLAVEVYLEPARFAE